MPREKLYNVIKQSSLALTIALLVAVLFLGIFESLIRAQSNEVKTQSKLERLTYSNLLRSSLDRDLNALLFLPNGLASYLNAYHNELETDKVNAVLSDLYARTKHVRNIAVAVGYTVTYVYPIEGNEQALDLNYLTIPEQRSMVEKAVETAKGVLAGPLNLVQGGQGLIYRYPVFIDGQYWGIISIVINTEPFLDGVFKDIKNPNFKFAIRNLDDLGIPQATFYGDSSLFTQADALLIESEVPGGKWEWAVVRNTEAATEDVFLMLEILGLVFSMILGITMYSFLRERSKLKMQAMYDSLTGLANRRLLNNRLEQVIMQSKRFNRQLAVMYIDLDHFKKLNDTYGHAFGDSFLKVFAEKLTASVRKADTLSRIGGDEFVIILEEIQDKQSAILVCQNVIKAFAKPILVGNTPISVSLSIGVAIYDPMSDDTIEDLMKKADIALYQVKDNDRNGFKLYGETP
jgi:diguanylate cyclase